MLNQRKQSLTPLALLEPDIPGRTRPIMDSGEWGINLAAAKLNFPEDGLLVQIPVWLHKGLGDLVELLLHEKVVDQKYIEDPAELTQRTTLWVAERHIPSGSYSLSYRVTRLNQTPETQTPPLRLYVKLELPGGQDTNPEPGHSNLFMHIPPEIISGGVDKEVAEAGVPITIRSASGTGLPYPNIAEGDCVILSWGGIFMFSDPVTDLQISDPVNHPLIIHVTKEVIERSGDSDSSGLAVTYKLRDIVGNESTDWSDAIRIVVNIGISLLLAPIVKEAINNVIDLDELGDDQLTAQVWATDSTLQKNDVIHLKMRGTTESGETIEVAAEPQTVDNLPHTYEFYFDNVDVRKLTNTQVTFLYTVVRADTPEPLRSKGQFVQVIGEAQRLAAPRVIDEHQGAINPDLHYVRLHIPHNPLIVQGSALDIIWFGRRPDGSTHNPELDWYFPDNQEASDPEGFVITVATIEDNHLKTLEGGTLTIAYYLLTVEGDDTVSRESRHTNAFQVGEPQFELIKPDILGEQDGVLKPEDLSNGTSRLTAPRPTGTPSENKDVVIFTWFGEITGKVEDSVNNVEAWVSRYGNAPRSSCAFNIDPAQFQLSIDVRPSVPDGDGWNEVMVETWPQDIPLRIPLEAFYYSLKAHYASDGLSQAQFAQRDYFQTTGRFLPIVLIDLEAPANQVFTYNPVEQNSPGAPARVLVIPDL
ncbi:hypothetical protein NN484_19480 [Pseudomonas serboccidentalis]|uniref:Ig-like domain-containing protein n=1 Tax=Pseudomonas serboccidentalis TaxID=2964670 RepID=A0ABY7Z5I3_9PSED|nr:hypothetical protein [Pseudomonas serboccidentalis]WDR34677.1 hypothetical protein NN484_19480 [Pseudomonas serboccidentalis]